MTYRDFFRITIKLFGLYGLIISLFQFLPTAINFVFNSLDIWLLFFVICVASLILALYRLLLKKGDRIIDWLKLDLGFDHDTIDMGAIQGKDLVTIATILIGGSLLVGFFPSFIYQSYILIKEIVQSRGVVAFESTILETNGPREWVIAGINLAIGYLLLVNYQNVAHWILKVNKKNME